MPRLRSCVQLHVGSVVLTFLLLISCRATPITPGHAASGDADTEASVPPEGLVATRPARGAFVVTTPGETIVVPTRPDRPGARLPGLFVGDPSSPDVAYGRVRIEVVTETDVGEEVPRIPYCPDDNYADECALDEGDSTSFFASVELRRDVGTVRVTQTLPCDCIGVAGISTDAESEPEFDLTDPEILEMIEMSPYSPDEYEENCGAAAFDYALDPTSVLNGVLYETGMIHNNVCSGLNLYDAMDRTVALRPGAVALAAWALEPGMDCVLEGAGVGGEMVMETLLPSDEADCKYGDEDCQGCAHVGEMNAFGNRRGHLVFAAANIAPVGIGCLCSTQQRLSTSNCLGPLEPCGDLAAFEEIDDASDYWIATDNMFALVADDERLLLVGADGSGEIRSIASASTILGVEYHSESVLLEAPEISQRRRVALPESDSGGSGARKLGNACYRELRAGRLDAAETACVDGLREGGAPRTRASIAYNLGRIAEARDNKVRALAFYRRSDDLRPNNAEVRARIRALK